MPITLMQPGETGIIKAVRGNEAIIKHLHTLGFVEGSPVRIISHVHENLIVEIKETRLAIEGSLAKRIFV